MKTHQQQVIAVQKYGGLLIANSMYKCSTFSRAALLGICILPMWCNVPESELSNGSRPSQTEQTFSYLIGILLIPMCVSIYSWVMNVWQNSYFQVVNSSIWIIVSWGTIQMLGCQAAPYCAVGSPSMSNNSNHKQEVVTYWFLLDFTFLETEVYKQAFDSLKKISNNTL